MLHKFILGQTVEYYSPRWLYAPPGIYVVTAKLPEWDGEFEYHIKHTSERHERMRGKANFVRSADDARQAAVQIRRLQAQIARRTAYLLGEAPGCFRMIRCHGRTVANRRTRRLP